MENKLISGSDWVLGENKSDGSRIFFRDTARRGSGEATCAKAQGQQGPVYLRKN